MWIATLADDSVQDLRPVQDLAGSGLPFQRLATLLGRGEFAACGIDAPLSVPRSVMPPGGRAALVAAVDALLLDKRPFPTAKRFLDRLAVSPQRKDYRVTEQTWQARGLNVRSSTWRHPRGGAPFTAAALKLIAAAGMPPCWPWVRSGPGLLAEVFPMAQLKQWGLPYQGYAGSAELRGGIIDSLGNRLDFGRWRQTCLDSPDALDAVLAALAARAVTDGTAPCPEECDEEGWIAVAD